MTDDIGESIPTAKTFRFASGQILSLGEDQIEKIPYLIALVSSADNFELVCDEDGHYKLDPHIEYTHFSFVLKSLSFHSVQQLFTCLPKQNDIIPIIALLDFLGIGPQPDPTLKEVDLIFFSTLVYSPMLQKYLQIIRPAVIQDMAVRFAIAMAKEEYDFTKRKVIDQIYWFIMFILSAYKLFGPRLRHHVYKIAEHCFSLFKPSLLKSLNKLVHSTEKDTRKLILTTNDEDASPDAENKCPLEQIFDLGRFNSSNLDHFSWADNFSLFRYSTLERRQKLLLYRTYTNYHRIWYSKAPSEEELLEPVYKRVLEIMYERLQSEISRCAVDVLHRRKSAHKFEEKVIILWRNYHILEDIDLPEEVDDIFKRELVQEEIRERILEEICVLIPKLEKRRGELVTELREYEQHLEILHEGEFHPFYYFSLYPSHFETAQEEALSYELILEKIHHGSSIVEQIHRQVLKALREDARKQFNQWKRTQQDIDELRQWLSSCRPPEDSSSVTSKTMYRSRRIPINKPLPKLQLKYSAR